jgi:hypothetical protein
LKDELKVEETDRASPETPQVDCSWNRKMEEKHIWKKKQAQVLNTRSGRLDLPWDQRKSQMGLE